MTTLKKILSYYRDCYKEDSSDFNLWNLNKLKQEDRLILEGKDELGTGFLPRLPIPESFAEQMAKRMAIYQREKVLLYVRYILVGKLEVQGEVKPIISPLLFNEAFIEMKEQDYYFSINSQTPDYNEPLLQLLMPESTLEIETSTAINSPSYWTSLLKNSPLKLDSLNLLNFPSLVGDSEIKKALKRKTPSLLPVSMLVFVERSKSSRGVLHELESIISSKQTSAPLKTLFTDVIAPESNKTLKHNYLPGLLSSPQQEVLSIAANHQLGCTSGPPGTGKSYTIAAIAAEHMARGESVLIVANNDPALDVIAEKLDDNFGLSDISIRASQRRFIKKFKNYLDSLLGGYYNEEFNGGINSLEVKLNSTSQSLNKLEKSFIRFCSKAIKRGKVLKKLEEKEANWLKSTYLLFVKSSIKRLKKQWLNLDKINAQQIKREQLASHYLNTLKNKNLRDLIDNNRKSLVAFSKAVRSRTSKSQFEFFNDIEYNSLLSAFPIWLVNISMLHRVLPLNAEMFDLVIIDEATQCNISSTLPALYRAKRAMIVGDTKQLKHYSFLAKTKEEQLRVNNNLTPHTKGVVSYRDHSILELTLNSLHSQKQVAFLDEHFRSKPELIHFSNQQFYQKKLKVMQHRPCTSSGHLHLNRVNGKRNRAGVNHLETQEIISTIKAQINESTNTGIHNSIGVVSPFRKQAEDIAKAIENNFDEAEISKYKIRSATPYGFQGEERDIMLISFSLDDNSARAAVYLNKEDVFNVAITRARQKQHLFISFDENNLPSQNLLKKYINSISEFKANHITAKTIDEFQADVIKELNKHKIETWSGYAIAGTEIDILCRHNHYLAIDLIGFPGPWGNFFELNTYKVFKRAGIEVTPISYGLWVADKELCVQHIIKKLQM